MKSLTYACAITALALTPATAFAGTGNKSKNSFKVERVARTPILVGGKKKAHCPPGLAKKAVPCVPPGQVKNRYRVGDRIDRDYILINDPYRYGLNRGSNYVRAGDYVYRIDPDTRKVLNLIGAVADILY